MKTHKSKIPDRPLALPGRLPSDMDGDDDSEERRLRDEYLAEKADHDRDRKKDDEINP